jgi:hypothetical protein
MPTTTFTIARRFGRLANRLVITANFAAYVCEHGGRLVNYPMLGYSRHFDHLRGDLTCSFPARTRQALVARMPLLSRVLRKSRIGYHVTRYSSRMAAQIPLLRTSSITLHDKWYEFIDHRGVISLDNPVLVDELRRFRRVFVNGWQYRAPQLLAKHGDTIRNYLRPRAKIFDEARRKVEQLRQSADIVAGVHRRHGDYRTWLDGRYFFDDHVYLKWMNQVADQLSGRRVAFLVCSDAPLDPRHFGGHTIDTGLTSPLADLTALSLCDLVFGPVSTFSQWASYAGATPLVLLRRADEFVDLSSASVSLLDVLPGITPDESIGPPFRAAA